jgi:hypothetical protein
MNHINRVGRRTVYGNRLVWLLSLRFELACPS